MKPLFPIESKQGMLERVAGIELVRGIKYWNLKKLVPVLQNIENDLIPYFEERDVDNPNNRWYVYHNYRWVNDTGNLKVAQFFTDKDRSERECIITFENCKIGGSYENKGVASLLVDSPYKDLVINIENTVVVGRGGDGRISPLKLKPGFYNKDLAPDNQYQAGEFGDPAITVSDVARETVKINIKKMSLVASGGGGGGCGWYITGCGGKHNAGGGAGGGGAGYPAGRGGMYENDCTSAISYGSNGSLREGGAGGMVTSFGNGCPPKGDITAQIGPNGGNLSLGASRLEGCYPISERANKQYAIINLPESRVSVDTDTSELIGGFNQTQLP